jgi:hypothetical protein
MGIALGVGGGEDGVDEDEGADDLGAEPGAAGVARGERVGVLRRILDCSSCRILDCSSRRWILERLAAGFMGSSSVRRPWSRMGQEKVEAWMRRRGTRGEACAAASGEGSESAAASGDWRVEATRHHAPTQ